MKRFSYRLGKLPTFPSQQENQNDVVPWNRSACQADYDLAP